MRKRLLSMTLAALMLVSLLSGCGNAAAPQSSSQSAQATPTETASKEEVVVAISSEPSTLDPCQGWGHGTTPLVQSTLVEYDYDMSFVNDLATDYKLSDDGLTWTFTLREDAKFTDGEPVRASDVKFTFDTAKDSQSSLDLTFLDSVEAPDDTTVIFHLDKPTAPFLNTVASVGIVPEHAYGKDYGTHPIGSGPYKFVQWNQQEQLMLEANEDYYGKVPSIKQ